MLPQMQTDDRSLQGVASDPVRIGSIGRPLVRYRAHALSREVIKVGPGDLYVGSGSEIIRTTLGSCIAVCMYAPVPGLGGMNHFVLAGPAGGLAEVGSTRYGECAMQQLEAMLLARGACRRDLQLKVFGGAALLGRSDGPGAANVAFVRKYARVRDLNVVAEDLGGSHVRQLLFFPATGQVRLHRSSAALLHGPYDEGHGQDAHKP